MDLPPAEQFGVRQQYRQQRAVPAEEEQAESRPSRRRLDFSREGDLVPIVDDRRFAARVDERQVVAGGHPLQ